jgi:hypothetical protein
MPDAEAGVQTATPGGPIAFRSHAAARPCAPPTAAVVKAIVARPVTDAYRLILIAAVR